jgi:polysaccharide chain length determinant protein (PEP-CTERM system associated)
MSEPFERFFTLARGAWLHRKGMLAVAWSIALAGWLAVYWTPDEFRASAIVHVDTRALVGVDTLIPRANIEQQLALVSKTLLTRANLEKVARNADLDTQAGEARAHEALIDRLAARIELRSLGRENLFVLAYHERDAQTAQRVVAALVAAFTEDGLRAPRTQLHDSLRFIEQRIAEHQDKLASADEALKQFKREHFDALPEHGRDFYARLVESGDKLRQAQIELREAGNARDALQAQLNGETPVVLEAHVAPGTPQDPLLAKRIENLQENLLALRLKYTEQHPDIVAAKRLLAQLEAQATQTPSADATPARNVALDPALAPLKAALAEAQARVAALEARVEEYAADFAQRKAQLDRIPGVEADLKQLTRDYDVIKSNYEQLLAQREKLALGQAQALQGLRISLVEPPRAGTAPARPNRLLWTSMVLLGALAAGVLYGVLTSELRPTFLDKRALRRVLERPTLGSVSVVQTAWIGAKTSSRFSFAATLLALLVCYALLVGFYWYSSGGGHFAR